MTNSHTNEIADNVCPNVEVALASDEQRAALDQLRKDAKADTSAMSSDQAKDYILNLTQKLRETNQLPELSLVYADQLGTDLSREDLRSELRSVNRDLTFGENDKQLDKAFIRFLLDNYDGGANLVEAKDEESGYDSNISRADIAAKLAEFQAAKRSPSK